MIGPTSILGADHKKMGFATIGGQVDNLCDGLLHIHQKSKNKWL